MLFSLSIMQLQLSFCFCSFIEMFVRNWIAVPVRAKTEVAEQPISGHGALSGRRVVGATTRSQINENVRHAGPRALKSKLINGLRCPCGLKGKSLCGPSPGHGGERAVASPCDNALRNVQAYGHAPGKQPPYAERRASDQQGPVAPWGVVERARRRAASAW